MSSNSTVATVPFVLAPDVAHGDRVRCRCPCSRHGAGAYWRSQSIWFATATAAMLLPPACRPSSCSHRDRRNWPVASGRCNQAPSWSCQRTPDGRRSRFSFRDEAVSTSVSGASPGAFRARSSRHDATNATESPPASGDYLLTCSRSRSPARAFPPLHQGATTGERLARTRQFERGYERQRQLLAAALKANFGIDDDPLLGPRRLTTSPVPCRCERP